jgi:hypothetical protein
MPLHGGGGIDIDGRADGVGDLGEGHVLAMQDAAAQLEMIHP